MLILMHAQRQIPPCMRHNPEIDFSTKPGVAERNALPHPAELLRDSKQGIGEKEGHAAEKQASSREDDSIRFHDLAFLCISVSAVFTGMSILVIGFAGEVASAGLIVASAVILGLSAAIGLGLMAKEYLERKKTSGGQ